MTLTQLLEITATKIQIPASRQKDLRTSIRYLAKALGKDTPDRCHEEDFLTADTTWKAALNRYLSTLTPAPSPYTVRNTRNNLSYLFRQARAQSIIQPICGRPPSRLRKDTDHELRQAPLYKTRMKHAPYRLPLDQWPAELQKRFNHYAQQRQLKMRETTIQMYRQALEYYVGYLINVKGTPIEQWEELFNCDLLGDFMHWQSTRSQVRMTTRARYTGLVLRAIANYEKLPHAQTITEYVRELPQPEPMHDKRHHWFTLRELEEVGLGLLQDARTPLSHTKASIHPGVRRATNHAMALILRLLVRIPLRQRNIREMRLEHNLYQDGKNQWQLRFRGEELKVSQRKGRINTITFNLSQDFPDLIPHLEEYLKIYRPYFPKAEKTTFLFLGQFGNQLRSGPFSQELQMRVYQRTGKRVYPHLIRTIWATEMLERGLNIDTVAYMLNDNPLTVLNKYHELLAGNHAQKASHILQNLFSVESTVLDRETRSA